MVFAILTKEVLAINKNMKNSKKNHTRFRLFHKVNPTLQLVLAIGLFVVAVLASRSKDVGDWEISLFRFFYGLPDFLQPFFFVVTQLGSIWILGLLFILFLALKKHQIVLRLMLTGLLAYLISGFAKDIWGRIRPQDLLLDVVNLDYIVRGPGFPSGHMALATALALTLGWYLKGKYYWLVVAWIGLVGISRMYLGIHFPLDILGGFAIGWFSYAIFRHVSLHEIKFRKKRLVVTKVNPPKPRKKYS